MRRTMVKSTVGHVQRTTYDLPDAKNPNHVYGYELPRDPENAGQVIGKWVHATPSPATTTGRSFIETNRQAIIHGCVSAGENRKYANEHPGIVVKPARSAKAVSCPRTTPPTASSPSESCGLNKRFCPLESEDIWGLVQARYTSFSNDDAYYPDLGSMKTRGKLPLPRETRCSIGKDVRNYPRASQREPFKMSKFKTVGPTLYTQPNARKHEESDEDYQYQCADTNPRLTFKLKSDANNMTRLLSPLLLLGLLPAASCASSSVQIRGVAPSDQARTCPLNFRALATNLPISRVNDEFCDCDDGQDEPGTAACSYLINAQFHCENEGFPGKIIMTSFSKEEPNDLVLFRSTRRGFTTAFATAGRIRRSNRRQVPVSNTCAAAADKFRKEAEQRLEVVKTGFEKRQATINGEIADTKGRGTTLKELVGLKLLQDRVTVHKDHEELKEKKYRMDIARQKQAEGHEGEETSKQQFSDAAEQEAVKRLDAVRVADDDVPVNSAEDERASEVLDSRRGTVKSLVELPDGTRIPLADYLRMNHKSKLLQEVVRVILFYNNRMLRAPRTAEEMRREDFLGPLFNGGAEGRKRIGLYALRTIGIVISPVRALVELILFSPRTLWSVLPTSEIASSAIDKLPDFPYPSRSIWFRQLGGGSVYDGYSSVMWGARVVWDAPVYAYHFLL
ncbi:protein of unknown function DUF4483 [Phytophthora cactorum]|nr:protein of unknown function DUF4483 [Phytophthora cactorum]